MKINAYAKINLSLNVLSRLPNNYHKLEMINLPLALHDEIIIKTKPRYKKTIVKTNVKELNNNNIVLKAVEVLRKKYGFGGHFLIKIKKRIPLSSGLGGGSADAAAVLRALFKVLNIDPTYDEKIQIALLVGADVPYCLFNQPTIVEEIGEKLTFFSLKKHYSVLIVKPTKGLSTREVFENVDLKTVEKHNTKQIADALVRGDLDSLNNLIGNNLEKPAMSLLDEVKIIKEMMINDQLKNVLMSGAGSAVFSLDEKEKHLLLANKYKQLGYNVFITETLVSGEKI